MTRVNASNRSPALRRFSCGSERAEGPWARRAASAEYLVMNGLVIFVGAVVIAIAAVVLGRRRHQSHK